jgi:hypothetical protein
VQKYPLPIENRNVKMSEEKLPTTPKSSQDDFLRWSAQTQRTKSVANYTKIMREADQQSVVQVQNLASQIEKSLKTAQIVHTLTICGLGLLLIISLGLVLLPGITDFQRMLGIFIMPVSMFIILVLIYRSPLRSARHLMGETIKMQVVYLSYLRQINQVDMSFKQNFVNTDKFTAKQMQETFSKTQEIIDKAMDDVNLLLDDIN